MPSDGPAPPPPPPPRTPPPHVGRSSDRGPARFAEPRRLHPASVVLGIDLRQIIQALLFPAAATFAAGPRVMLIVLTIVALIGLTARVLVWQRFRYAFDGEVLRVDEGVLSRNYRALDVARIQQVEVDRSFVQRVLGLATLRVETAGSSSEVEVELRVVPEDDATALRAAVREGKARALRHGQDVAGQEHVTADAEPRRELLRVPSRHVVLASVTGVRLLVFPAVIAGAFQFLAQAVEDWADRALSLVINELANGEGLRELTLTTGLVLAGAVLGVSVVAAVVVGLLRDANFVIERVGDDLHVSRGLLARRDAVLPLRRLQLVQVQRNWLRRLLRVSTVRILSAGGSLDAERRVMVPLLADARTDALIRDLYPGADGVPSLAGHPRAAARRAVFRWLRTAAIPVALIWLLPFAWLDGFERPSLVLLALAPVLGVVEYRQLGHGVGDRLLAARQGALSVTTTIAPLVKVQGVTSRANWFQRRLGLTTVDAHVAGLGGGVEVLDAGRDDAHALHAELTEHAASPLLVGPAAETASARTAPD